MQYPKKQACRTRHLSYSLYALLLCIVLAACGSYEAPQNAEVPNLTGMIGTGTVHLPGTDKPMEVVYEIVGNHAIFDGDIFIGEVDEHGHLIEGSGLTPQAVARLNTDFRWPEGVIPYTISGNFDSHMRSRINAAIADWENKTSIDFVPYNASRHTDYVDFVDNNYGDPCYSALGRQSGRQTIMLNYVCQTGAIIHEIGHAVGLYHEQQRGDRDNHVEIKWHNIADREDAFCKVAGGTRTEDEQVCVVKWGMPIVANEGFNIRSYDYDSIMHYKKDAFAREPAACNGTGVPQDLSKCTILPKNGVDPDRIGQREGLSAGDIYAVNWLYLNSHVVSYAGDTGSKDRERIDPERIERIKLTELAFADINSNGTTDLIKVDSSSFSSYLYYKEGGRGSWQALFLGNGAWKLSDLAFGDFNGNGTTDIFYADGSRWYYKEGGKGSWLPLASSGYRVSQLAFGDFNGNGTTDVFRANGSAWYYSEGANSAWTFLNSSSYKLSELGFGDFNGNGTTDVFIATGQRWYYSDGGKSWPRILQDSSYRLPSLAFGDFNGDNKTDVVRPSGAYFFISHGGTSGWYNQKFERLPPGVSSTRAITNTTGTYGRAWSFAFGDFNGDKRTDIFETLEVE